MKEILFRGKRADNGEWIYGNFIHSKRFEGCFNEFRIYETETGIEHDVVSETVGQFTGLTDKYGKKIFEGDIIRYTELEEDILPFIEVVDNIHDNSELLK